MLREVAKNGEEGGRPIHRGAGFGTRLWRRARGAVAAVVLAGLAIPSGGCLGDLMCSEGCYGEMPCERYAPAECGSHAGCQVTAQGCVGSESCAVLDDEDACSARSSFCRWERNCC
jgi:hypothetical protein